MSRARFAAYLAAGTIAFVLVLHALFHLAIALWPGIQK